MKLLLILRKRRAPDFIQDDAVALIASFGACAYDQARTRARDVRLGRIIDGNRVVGHWDKVRREIARRMGRQVGVDTATRYLNGHEPRSVPGK